MQSSNKWDNHEVVKVYVNSNEVIVYEDDTLAKPYCYIPKLHHINFNEKGWALFLLNVYHHKGIKPDAVFFFYFPDEMIGASVFPLDGTQKAMNPDIIEKLETCQVKDLS